MKCTCTTGHTDGTKALFFVSSVLVGYVTILGRSICSWPSLTDHSKTQTFTTFNVTKDSPLPAPPQFFLYFNRSVSSRPDKMMIYHQMLLRDAIENASALYTTCIHEYMNDVGGCFSKIKLAGVTKKCQATRHVLLLLFFYTIYPLNADHSGRAF
jgi:hypothetical protein